MNPSMLWNGYKCAFSCVDLIENARQTIPVKNIWVNKGISGVLYNKEHKHTLDF